jgi:uroporphyrin-III C-methyltransferase
LLTVLALSALQQADAVVYDALVDESILKLARPGATIEYAGKRGGKPSPRQRDISLRLIEAYAGIPATHRDVNHAVTFVTGHNSVGEVPDDLDWHALAKGSPVLVIYMGLKHLSHIRCELLAAGRRTDEPVALVSHATTARQRVLETTLGRAVEDAKAHAVEAPVLIVIGEVVRMRAGLDWLGAMSGKTLDADPLDLRPASRHLA